MEEKVKNQVRNTIKEEEEGFETVKPVRKKKERVSWWSTFTSLFNFLYEEKFQKVAGAFFLFIVTPYLLLAFTSFLFTWKVDQDKVFGSWFDLFTSEIQVSNWLGKLGAVISHQFIHRWFGVASFLFVGLTFLLGLRILFKATLFPLRKAFKYSFFSLVWISVALGYIFSRSHYFLGGGFGYTVNHWLSLSVGSAGTGFLIVFSLLTFMIIAFNISFEWFSKPKEEPPAADAGFEVVQPENIFKNPEVIKQKNEAVELTLEEKQDEEKGIALVQAKLDFDAEEVEDKKEEMVISSGDDGVVLTVENTQNEEEVSAEQLAETEQVPLGEYDPTLDLGSYEFPSIELLEQYGSREAVVNAEELNANKNRIVETLNNYGIQIEKIKATIGPTVTLYEIIPVAGVRIAKIKNLEDDIALSLSALGIRIIAPIPGKGTIGIEVPNQHPEMVSMRSILASEKFQNTTMELPIGLGKTISNETFIADLAKMPHLLMAGATGQGKSVGLNAVLVSLLYKKHPSQIKFVLVDPKKVELTLFSKIERHFLAKLPDDGDAIITDTKKVVHTLNSLCIEMDQRYDLLKEAQVRNLKEYNAKFIARKLNPNKGHKFLPYIVLVIDEFADLIMTAGKEVETPIARLAQLARAIGIHLIIATQRPSVNIITGTIKANFPARIAFRVTSKIDSRTILDSGGADQLIGRGDMLLSTGSDLIRIQCAFVDTPEVDKITDFIGNQRGYVSAFMLPEYVGEEEEGGKDIDLAERDSFFAEAARVVVQHQQGSASLLQRKLKLGYNRAGRIVDQLEAAGIIGKFEGSKAREVKIKDPMSLEQFLNNLDKTPQES